MYLSLLIIDFQVVVKAGILDVSSFLMSDNNSMIHKALLKNNNIFVIFTKLIDRMHKWHPKKIFFCLCANQPRYPCQHGQNTKKKFLQTRLVGLISIKDKRVLFWLLFLHSVCVCFFQYFNIAIFPVTVAEELLPNTL